MQRQEDVPLAPLTTLGVGGPAEQLVVADHPETLIEALDWAKQHRVPVRLLGGGSNLVVSDDGIDGLVIRIGWRGITRHDHEEGVEITAAAGEPWDAFVGYTVEQGLCGLECLSGIPGQVGATPIQNVGAYGRDVGEVISKVRVLDRETLEPREISSADCDFGYRTSAFKSTWRDRFVVLEVTYRLKAGATPTLRYAELQRHFAERGVSRPSVGEVRAAVLDTRAQKSMLHDPRDPNGRNCGSFFVNPVVSRTEFAHIATRAGTEVPHYDEPDGRVKVPAAWLIQHAGFAKGSRDGAVGLSTKHTLAIVALDGARAHDIVRFARRIRNAVEQRFGVRLVPEPVMWGFSSLDHGLPDERLA